MGVTVPFQAVELVAFEYPWTIDLQSSPAFEYVVFQATPTFD